MEAGKAQGAASSGASYPFSGPVFVLTHQPPDSPDPTVTVLSGDIREAVATALDAAGGKNLEILGAGVATQCLQRGLVDEILVYVLPVLLGVGIRFSPPGLVRIDLEPLSSVRWGLSPSSGSASQSSPASLARSSGRGSRQIAAAAPGTNSCAYYSGAACRGGSAHRRPTAGPPALLTPAPPTVSRPSAPAPRRAGRRGRRSLRSRAGPPGEPYRGGSRRRSRATR